MQRLLKKNGGSGRESESESGFFRLISGLNANLKPQPMCNVPDLR